MTSIRNIATAEVHAVTGYTPMGWMIGAFWLNLANGEQVASFDVITPDTPEHKRIFRHWQVVEVQP